MDDFQAVGDNVQSIVLSSALALFGLTDHQYRLPVVFSEVWLRLPPRRNVYP